MTLIHLARARCDLQKAQPSILRPIRERYGSYTTRALPRQLSGASDDRVSI